MSEIRLKFLCPEDGYQPKNSDRDEFISDFNRGFGWTPVIELKHYVSKQGDLVAAAQRIVALETALRDLKSTIRVYTAYQGKNGPAERAVFRRLFEDIESLLANK